MDERKDMGMDAVDEKQQQQIVALQERNRTLERLGVVFGVLLVFGFVLLLLVSSGNVEIYCPHKECPHSVVNNARK